MEEIKALVKDLLKHEPFDVCINDMFNGGYVIRYKQNDSKNIITYVIDIYETCDNKYKLFLNVTFDYNTPREFFYELTEKEYMEIKWKIEEWANNLNVYALNKFTEYVNSFPKNPMDALLDD